jgi:hypothetical protein
LILRDAAMHHFTVVGKVITLPKLISIFFGCGKDDHFSITHVA